MISAADAECDGGKREVADAIAELTPEAEELVLDTGDARGGKAEKLGPGIDLVGEAGEDEHEHQREPEGRHGVNEQRREGERVIERRVLPDRLYYSEADADAEYE